MTTQTRLFPPSFIMKSQLCPKCQKVLTDDALVQVYTPHHQSRESILAAVGNGCRLCSRIVKSREFAKLDPSISFITTGNIRRKLYWKASPASSVKLEIWLHPSSHSEAYQHVSEADGDRVSAHGEVLIPQSGRDFQFEHYDGPGSGLLGWTFLFSPKTGEHISKGSSHLF